MLLESHSTLCAFECARTIQLMDQVLDSIISHMSHDPLVDLWVVKLEPLHNERKKSSWVRIIEHLSLWLHRIPIALVHTTNSFHS